MALEPKFWSVILTTVLGVLLYQGFVIWGFLPIQITAILPAPKILCYNGEFVILGFGICCAYSVCTYQCYTLNRGVYINMWVLFP